MTHITKEVLVEKTCLLLIQHFRNLIDAGTVGFNSRIFEHMLHREFDFVGIGHSPEVTIESSSYHPEHVVPCAVLISESRRLIEQGRLSDEEIAKLLQKHWKIARITPEQAGYIDGKEGLGYKHTMPSGWDFETGETLARLKAAKITIVTKS